MERIFASMGAIVLATLAPFTAMAEGQFLCHSSQPYTFHALASGTSDRSNSHVRWVTTELGKGKPIVGPKPTIVRPGGFVIVRVESEEGVAVEIHNDGKILGRKNGVALDAHIYEGKDPKLLLTTYDPRKVVHHKALAEQVILGAHGQVLASRQLVVPIGEDSPVFRFTADGSGVYRMGAEMHEVDAIEVFGIADFRKLWSIAFDSYAFTSVYMQTPTTGFAIGEGGQLFRFDSGNIIPVESGGAGFNAHDIVGDERSGRILVRGGGGYRIFDWSGKLLLVQTDGPKKIISDAKLAIDGSVAEHDSRVGKYLVRINNDGNYSRTMRLPLSDREWSNVACFTPNSAALVDFKGNPRLIDFRARR